jgi:hypothetical protein
MPRCIAFTVVKGSIASSVVRCKSSVIANESMVCKNVQCQSMGIRMWLADSAVAMSLSTYLCESGEFSSKLMHHGEDGLLFDVASVYEKPDIAKFVKQVGTGKVIMGLMEQAAAQLHTKSVIVNADCAAMAQLLVSQNSSNGVSDEKWTTAPEDK